MKKLFAVQPGAKSLPPIKPGGIDLAYGASALCEIRNTHVSTRFLAHASFKGGRGLRMAPYWRHPQASQPVQTYVNSERFF